MDTNPQIKYLLWFVFAASRGGINRMRIISNLRAMPLNANQLSVSLNLNYKAIQHHLKVLESNNLVLRIGGKYGAAFFISPLLEGNIRAYEQLATNSGKFTKTTSGNARA